MLSQYTSESAGVASESHPRVDWEQGSLKQVGSAGILCYFSIF